MRDRRRPISETRPVRDALDALRRRGERPRLDDLVVRGAAARLREIEAEHHEDERQSQLRRELLEQLRTGEHLDADAAEEVRRGSWTH